MVGGDMPVRARSVPSGQARDGQVRARYAPAGSGIGTVPTRHRRCEVSDYPPPPGGQVPPPPGGYEAGGTPPPPPGYSQPAYGQPGPGSETPGWSGPPLADYGQRVIAYLIDIAVPFVAWIAIFIVGLIIGAVVRPLGLLIDFVGYLAVIVYSFWNWAYLQGTTGQSLGKRQQGISLVKEDTLQPLGFGMTVVRYLVAGALSSVTCGIYGLLDILFPLWDAKRQRITDKILKNAVIKSQPGTLDVNSFNPFAK